MNTSQLQKAYDPEEFRQQGHALVDLLADHLQASQSETNDQVINCKTPHENLENWKAFFSEGNPKDLFPNVLKNTTHIHHPRYIGHQVSPSLPFGALSNLVGGLLNNGMAVYEMGMAPTAMERLVTDWLCKKVGFSSKARGFLTSGGTLANLTALLTARNQKMKGSWDEGTHQQLGIMVSEEAHYCVNRAAKIMGLGEKGIVQVPVNAEWTLDDSQLEARYHEATSQGIHVFAIVGSAPTTATGIFDDLQAIGEFAEKRNLWFHVDGAHGGAGILSSKYKHTLTGIEMADSVVIDGHKMMLMPTITTALLYKQGADSYTTFSQKADYLLEQSEEEDWYNGAKRTFECTKTMMSLHWYGILKHYGEGLFDEYITNQYDKARLFAQMIAAHPAFELAVQPQSNIVCFRYAPAAADKDILNTLNLQIREELLQEGHFYIVQTKLGHTQYLRTTIMNPFTEQQHLESLLETIVHSARKMVP